MSEWKKDAKLSKGYWIALAVVVVLLAAAFYLTVVTDTLNLPPR